MARVVLPIAGAVVGSFFGQPQLGFAIGSVVGSLVDPIKVPAPALGQIQVQTAREGQPIPIVYGTVAIAGNLIWTTDASVVKSSSSGKGGPKVSTNSIFRSFAIGLCEGPIGGVLRIWEDEKLVYDARPDPEIPMADSAAFIAGVNLHLGDEDQLPDSEIEAHVGVLAPFYRGLAYAVFVRKDLTDRTGRIPQYRFEVSSLGALDVVTQVLDWQLIGDLAADTDLQGVGVSGDNIVVLATTDSGGLTQPGYFSIDGGANWSLQTTPSQIGSTAVYKVDGSWFYLSGILRLVFRSDDQGGSFSVQSSNLPTLGDVPIGFPQVVTKSGTGFVAFSTEVVGQNVWRTNDFISWQDDGVVGLGSGLVVGPRLASNGDTVVAVSTTGELLHSPDNGKTFVDISNSVQELMDAGFGVQATSILYEDAIDRYVILITSAVSGSIAFGSTDGGSTWVNLGVSKTSETVVGDVVSDGTYWYGVDITSGNQSGRIMRSLAGIAQITTAVGAPVPLSSIVFDIADRAQIGSSVDVSALTDRVLGYALGGFFTAADAIRPLQSTHFFDAYEAESVLVFRPLGSSAVVTVTEDDFVEGPDSARRSQPLEFPRKLNLSYQSPTLGYETTKQTAERTSPDVRVTGERNLSTPEVLDEVTAARIADIAMKVAWTEVGGVIKLGVHHGLSWLTESDVIHLDLRGKVRRLRIERITLDDGFVRLECRPDRQSAYSSTKTPDPLPTPRPPASTNPGVTVWHWLNIPALVDQDDRLGGYFAATGASEGWAGALLQRSTDGGATWVDTLQNNGAIIGVLLDALPGAPEFYTDTTNTLRVELVNGADELESTTDAGLLNEANAAVVGNEVIQFRDAVNESGNIWVLTTLLRGRLNTDSLGASAGARFVFLRGATFVDNNISQIGQTLTHRGVGIGSSPETAAVVAEAYSPARTQYEWAPELLSGMIVGSTLSLSWVPRHRFGTAINPVPSVNFTGWSVIVTDGTNTVTAAPDAASVDVDVSALSLPITITVAAVNRITGLGEPASLEIA